MTRLKYKRKSNVELSTCGVGVAALVSSLEKGTAIRAPALAQSGLSCRCSPVNYGPSNARSSRSTTEPTPTHTHAGCAVQLLVAIR